MAIVPKQSATEKPKPTLEQRLATMEHDIAEIARGTNTHAALLESMISAFDSVIKTYLVLIGKGGNPDEKPKA